MTYDVSSEMLNLCHIFCLLYIDRFQRSSLTDVWFVDIDQLWLEFVVSGSGGTSERSSRRRTVPLVDNFPVMAWMSRLTPDSDSMAAKAASNSVSHAPSQTFCAVVRLGTKDLKAQVFRFLLHFSFWFIIGD